jgi:hypothetical protein
VDAEHEQDRNASQRVERWHMSERTHQVEEYGASNEAELTHPARRVCARRYNGATYVIAVNTSTSPTNTSFTIPGLGGRKLKVFRDGRIVTPLGDLVVDKLPGLGVAVYVVPPPGW